MSDTEQIITAALEDQGLIESTDDGFSEVDASPDLESDESKPEESTEPPAEAAADSDPSPEPDALLKDVARKKNNRIPYKRVERIVAKAREEAKAAAFAEAQALQERYSVYETPEFTGLIDSLRIAQENPARFLEALASADRRYAELLQAKREAAQSAQKPSGPNANVGPDVTLPDGSLGYSPEAFDRLLELKLQAAQAALEDRFAQRFGPIEQKYQQEQLYRGAVDRVQRQIADAETWPGFAENKAEITAAIKADRSLSLDQAYRKVVLPKLAASRDDIRKQVLAEINAKPKASQPRPSSGSASVTSSGPRDTEDIIKQSLRDRGIAF